MSKPKEPEFFARDDVYSNGLDWYSQLFESASADQICGEASTIYSLWPLFPNATKRMQRVIPNAKLIYIMRHPVDRAYSFYVQLIKSAQNENQKYKIRRTFEQCIFEQKTPACSKEEFFATFQHHLPDCPELFLSGSDYTTQIEHIENYFPKESILLLLFDDLMSEPAELLEKIYKFLGVNSNVDSAYESPIVENAAIDHMERKLENTIVRQLKNLPGSGLGARLLPAEFKSFVLNTVKSFSYFQSDIDEIKPKRMLPETRSHLINRFRESNRKLSIRLDRDLSHWNT